MDYSSHFKGVSTLTVPSQLNEKQQNSTTEPVCVVPVIQAGGAMSAYAYKHMKDVGSEEIRAHGGIDIGQTLIGMHLKQVAIPIRTSIPKVGEANVTVATTALNA